MKKIIETVEKQYRPKEGFACSKCPFASWSSGTIPYKKYELNETKALDKDEFFLECLCNKKHTLTFDSTNLTSSGSNGLSVIAYKHRINCFDKIQAVNEILNKEK